MKRTGFTLALVLASWLPASAQVTAEITLQQEQFLGGETMPAAVRITNLSGQALQFGSEPDWLTFLVESRDGFIVVKNGEVPVLGEFTLESSKVATRRVDLAPYFLLTHPGRYKVTATIRIKEWNSLITSKPASFDIIQGAKLWSRDFGVPPEPGATNASPDFRRYTLQQANYLRSQLHLYLRLTDAAESKVIKVFSLGPMVSFNEPESQLDKLSNLHVLFQNGARFFCYSKITPDGEVALRQNYEYSNTRPRLAMDPEGKVIVSGGMRRASPNDLPAPEPSSADAKRP